MSLFAQSSNCGCNVTITPTTSNPSITYRPWKTGLSGSNYIKIKAGQTLCLAAGNYNQLRFTDFQGTIDSPIIIKNCGGVVNLNTADYHTLTFDNCRYIKITGTGDNNISYGISLNGSKSGASGLVVTGLSTDVEIDHVKITKASFAGMMIKQDPSCNANTWKDNFTMYNIKVHDNYIRDVGGEGLYIGNSFWQQGVSRTCEGDTFTVYPHRILGLKIYNNIVKNTGWEAIQYGCAPDAEVFNNDVDSSGQAGVTQQCNGIQLGAGSGGKLYNNTIRNTKCGAILAVGFVDNTKIYNNLIVGSGDGMFIDSRDSTQDNLTMLVANNTLANITNVGLKVYDHGLNYYVSDSTGNRKLMSYPKNYKPIVKNNIVIGPYFGFQILGAAIQNIDSAKNYILKTPFTSAPKFFNAEKLSLFTDTVNYTLLPNASIIDWGVNLTALGILTDRFGNNRPQGNGFDIGWHESPNAPTFEPISNNAKAFESLTVYPSVSDNFVTVKLPPSVKKAKMTVFNAQGKIMFLKESSNSESNSEVTLDILTLQSGMYIINLVENNKAYYAKFIKS